MSTTQNDRGQKSVESDMVIAHSRGGLWAGLAVEAFIVAMAIFGLVVGIPVAALLLVGAGLWGGLIALWFAFTVRLEADERGLRGRLGLNRVDWQWREIERSYAVLEPQLRIVLADGTVESFLVPNMTAQSAADCLEVLREGGVVRVIHHRTGPSKERYPIPRSVRTYLALEKLDHALLQVNVLLDGPNLADLAKAARVLAVRAADEHRWDPTFTGKVNMLVSNLEPPDMDALRPLMEEALAGARRDLGERGWTVLGGAAFSLSWEVMRPK
jgi:hypothetical protein